MNEGELVVKKTPLNSAHRELGAKMVPFGGWDMPVSYEGVLAEHNCVRTACGIFDVSHMGEVRVTGPDAEKFLLFLAMNDVSKLSPGQGQYSGLLNKAGGMIDDIILYKLNDSEYFICVNASNSEKDFSWIKEHSRNFKVTVTNESGTWSQLAIQGPKSMEAMRHLFKGTDAFGTLSDLPYMGIRRLTLFGQDVLVARTGYTGEMGFEIYLPNQLAEKAWVTALESNPTSGIKPIGLGARDTLRLEACYVLYGNEMDDTVSPIEAGVAWAVKTDRPGDFIGKDVVDRQKKTKEHRKTFAFKMQEQAIPRHGMPVFSGSSQIGVVSSGSVLPTVGGAGGMALISGAFKIGDTVEVDVRGKRKLAQLVARPLYSARVK